MTKRPANIPADFKQWKIADGTLKWLPGWADKPLEFDIPPNEALRHCAHKRLPTSRKKSVKTRLKSQ